MPSRDDDKYFGGKGGSAKAHDSMIRQYGLRKGREVYHRTLNAKKKRRKHG